MKPVHIRIAVALLLVSGLAACGLKGPLKLPGDTAKTDRTTEKKTP